MVLNFRTSYVNSEIKKKLVLNFRTMGIVSQQLQTCNLLFALSRFNLEKKSKRATDAGTTVPSEATNSLKQLEHDNILKAVSPGDFIALQIMQYREELTQIGKVVKLNESSVSVEWLVGSYSGTFSFWKERRRVICESFLLRGTVCRLKLTPAMNLLKLMFVG